jgi:hypothetical protein
MRILKYEHVLKKKFFIPEMLELILGSRKNDLLTQTGFLQFVPAL